MTHKHKKLKIKNKELELDFMPDINKPYMIWKILCKASDNTLYNLRSNKGIYIYPNTLRHKGNTPVKSIKKIDSRLKQKTGILLGPLIFPSLHKSYIILLKNSAVRKINNTPIERILGIDLNKWTLEQLRMRYGMEMSVYIKKYSSDPYILNSPLNNPVFSENTKEDFIYNLRAFKSVEKKKDKIEIIGEKMIFDLCEVV